MKEQEQKTMNNSSDIPHWTKVLIVSLYWILFIYIGATYLLNQHTTPTAEIPDRPDDVLSGQPFPSLHLSSEYFSNKDIKGAEADIASPLFGRVDSSEWPWVSATIDSPDNYQSYPTTSILFKDYSNEIKPFTAVDPSNYLVKKKTVSVLSNGSKETLIFICSNDGSSAGNCYEIQLVKDNKVIFDVSSEYNLDIVPSSSGNGFYVKSENDVLQPSNCCSYGYLKTRFVFDGKVFKPIYEQTVYYLNVQNSTSSSVTSSGEITPLYFFSDGTGSTTVKCAAADHIDWQLAIFALSDYMEHGPGAKNKEDFGAAEIQRNFDENCERDMTIYNAAAAGLK